MKKIRYFDAHCDTIFRSFMTGEGLRSNGGHIALDRADAFEAYAQVFTFFFSADDAPEEACSPLPRKCMTCLKASLRQTVTL